MKTNAIPLLLLAAAQAAPSVLFAQHGEVSPGAATMHGGAAPAVLASVAFAEGVKEDKQAATFMKGFAQALFTRDGKLMVPHLAEKYVIEGWPADKNMHDAFVQAVGMIPGPSKILVTGITQEGDIKIVQTELAYAKRVAKRSFRFDPAGKLLLTDFISLKRPIPAKPAETATPASPQPGHK